MKLNKTAIKIANEIAEQLFTDGRKKKANRLVLEFDNGIDGTGWSKGPARDVIAEYITKAINEGVLSEERQANG